MVHFDSNSFHIAEIFTEINKTEWSWRHSFRITPELYSIRETVRNPLGLIREYSQTSVKRSPASPPGSSSREYVSSVDLVSRFNLDIMECFDSRFGGGTFFYVFEDSTWDEVRQNYKFIKIFVC